MRGHDNTGRGRGWGPFSGRQLTTIIVVLIVMLLLPVGAWAVSGSNVFVTDAGSGNHATVNGAGALTVAEASPKKFFVSAKTPTDFVASSTYTPLATPAAGTALVITQINVDVEHLMAAGSGGVNFAISKSDATCSHVVLYNSGFPLASLTPASVGVTTLPFHPGIVVPAGRSLCVLSGASTAAIVVQAEAFGYSVPATIAPPGA